MSVFKNVCKAVPGETSFVTSVVFRIWIVVLSRIVDDLRVRVLWSWNSKISGPYDKAKALKCDIEECQKRWVWRVAQKPIVAASESIAKAINELSRERIDQYKRNSLIAARELCWERESAKLVTALNSLVEKA